MALQIALLRRSLAAISLVFVLALAAKSALAQSEPISIFFDARGSAVNESALQIVAVVKDVLKPNVKLTIVGYCDTAEPDAMKLSYARALAVAKAFIDIGVPAGAQITITGKGATNLRKKTGPDVPEPVNRYTAITVSY